LSQFLGVPPGEIGQMSVRTIIEGGV
jgi:hypothetical protein